MSEIWTPDEDRVLIQSIINEELNYTETAEKLPDRSRHAVRHRWDRIKNRITPTGEYYGREAPIEGIGKVDLRACVFDIETMDFKSDGWQDHLVCCSFIPLDTDEPYTLQLKFSDKGNDKELLLSVLEELAKYDILIGHNVAAFDLNWLYSRAMYYGIRMPKSWVYFDTYQVAKVLAIKAASKSLAGLCAYFGLNSHKTSVQKGDWSKVASTIRAEFEYAMEEIVSHCEWDVIDNRELFNILWKYYDKKSLKRTKW